jgi:hypothetical protein
MAFSIHIILHGMSFLKIEITSIRQEESSRSCSCKKTAELIRAFFFFTVLLSSGIHISVRYAFSLHRKSVNLLFSL